jgi:hypothetical protein
MAGSALAALAVATLAAACAGPPEPPAQAASALPSPEKRPALTACDLLTKDEIQSAAGWPVAQAVPTHNPGPPALSICNFMGADLTKVITVWYGEGSGGRYKTSGEMAAALGTRDGMLVQPAQALHDLGLPATREDQRGGLVHVHGVNSTGDELTVAAGSFDVARALFVKALTRFATR